MAGLLLYAFGIVLSIRANIGYMAWDVFHSGLSAVFGISLGMINILVAAVIVAFVAYMREKIGLGTLLNMVVVGTFMDVFLLLPLPMPQTRLPGAAMMLLGTLCIAFATFLYVGVGWGTGPRDALMVILSRKFGWPVGVCRGTVEVTVTLAGWAMGGKLGWGTVFAAASISASVQLVFTLLRFRVADVKHETLPETLRSLSNPR